MFNILDNIVSDTTNDFVGRSEHYYALRSSEFVTKAVVYANTATKDVNVKKSRDRFNNALKPILSDKDLVAFVKIVTCEYEAFPVNRRRPEQSAGVKVQGRLVVRTLNIVVMVTRQKKKKQAAPPIQLESNQKMKKKDNYFRFKIDPLQV